MQATIADWLEQGHLHQGMKLLVFGDEARNGQLVATMYCNEHDDVSSFSRSRDLGGREQPPIHLQRREYEDEILADVLEYGLCVPFVITGGVRCSESRSLAVFSSCRKNLGRADEI